MQMIAPPINPALFAHSLIGEDGTLEDSPLTELLGSVTNAGYGFVLSSSDQQVLYANDAAKAVMRASQGLHCKNDRIGAVRRQSFWDSERLKIRESLARQVCNVMRLDDGASSGD